MHFIIFIFSFINHFIFVNPKFISIHLVSISLSITFFPHLIFKLSCSASLYSLQYSISICLIPSDVKAVLKNHSFRIHSPQLWEFLFSCISEYSILEFKKCSFFNSQKQIEQISRNDPVVGLNFVDIKFFLKFSCS